MTIKKANNGLSLEFLNMKLEFGFPARTLAAMALLGVKHSPKKIQALLTKASYKKIIDAAKEQILDEGMGTTWERFSDAIDYDDITEEMLETLSKRMVTLSKGVLAYDHIKEAE
tara:strand:- start:173 stop:514 length:342 start_codon:yes stop_codon:yes gene_type:complete